MTMAKFYVSNNHHKLFHKLVEKFLQIILLLWQFINLRRKFILCSVLTKLSMILFNWIKWWDSSKNDK